MTTVPADTELQTIDLYWEARGSGPAALLIAGTPGDAGQMTALADALASDHLVITYDRRGTSRSVAPAGWSQTSVVEQAGDAATVLGRVGVTSALVFGTSNGAAVALELALRHPGLVTRAVVHEMPLLSVLEDPAPVADALGSMIGAAMETGGPRAALDRFLRFAFGDDVVEAWPRELRQRMLDNAEKVFAIELPAFQSYRPDAARLAGCRVPVTVLVGAGERPPFLLEAARWLAEALGTEVASVPGGHGPQFSAPAELAAAIRDVEAGVGEPR